MPDPHEIRCYERRRGCVECETDLTEAGSKDKVFMVMCRSGGDDSLGRGGEEDTGRLSEDEERWGNEASVWRERCDQGWSGASTRGWRRCTRLTNAKGLDEEGDPDVVLAGIVLGSPIPRPPIP